MQRFKRVANHLVLDSTGSRNYWITERSSSLLRSSGEVYALALVWGVVPDPKGANRNKTSKHTQLHAGPQDPPSSPMFLDE